MALDTRHDDCFELKKDIQSKLDVDNVMKLERYVRPRVHIHGTPDLLISCINCYGLGDR